MEQFVRPAIAPQEFRDADGRVIPYGERWGMDGAPDDTYSVLSHQERFQPLHDVARALIAYLERNYDVAVSENPAHLADLPESYVTGTTAVRLTPASPGAASITLAFTSPPGIVVLAGDSLVEPLPDCGCDACDQAWEGAADDLEWMVMAVVEGGLSEQVTRWPRATVGYALERADGFRSSRGRPAADVTRHDLTAARKRLAEVGGRWEPWRPRLS